MQIDIKFYFLENCHIINKIMRQNEMRPYVLFKKLLGFQYLILLISVIAFSNHK
jgi:hypothetical protein